MSIFSTLHSLDFSMRLLLINWGAAGGGGGGGWGRGKGRAVVFQYII